ncbi:MAG: AtpZ/AtpI family protein [Mariniphaga sp.]|nr:AtpZ/AtpI family protein [Mariniphaga sp.]
MDEDNRKMNYLKEYAKYSSLVFQMIVIVAAGVLGGIQLDRLMNRTGSIFTISLTLFATFLALYYMFRTLLKK